MSRTKVSIQDLANRLNITLPGYDVALGHEDNIIRILKPIFETLEYDWDRDVTYKPSFTHNILGQRREADLGIVKYNNNLFGIVVDLKRFGERLIPEMVEKVAGYCGLAGALKGATTSPNNGHVASLPFVQIRQSRTSYVRRTPCTILKGEVNVWQIGKIGG